MNRFHRFRGLARLPGTAVQLGLVTLLGLPLVTPLLRSTAVPCTHDGHFYYYRLAAMRYTWDSGAPFSRWRPDVVFGYGYPFFNYREVVPLYAGLFLDLLGVPLPAAINFLHIMAIMAAGWFMFLWVRDVFGSLAGLVAAVAYMAAPFLLIDSLVRGSLNESAALALLPLIAWSGRRYVDQGNAWALLVSTFSLALLALSHNISAFLFSPFLVLYLIAEGWWQRLPWRTLAFRLALLFGLGLGMAAFFIGPAILELDQITILQAVSSRGNSYYYNFATIGEVLARVRAANPSLLNPPLFIRLGWAPAAFALMGFISLRWVRSNKQRGHIIFMALAAMGFIFMALAISTPLWERLPLLKFVQFPWRFIGRAAMPVAFLAGVPFGAMEGQISKIRRFPAAPPAALAILCILLEATPQLYPFMCPQEAQASINTVHEYEHTTGLLGVDAEGSYFPTTVLIRPKGSPLEEDYQAGRTPQRFDDTVLPSEATVERVTYDPLSAHVTLTSPVPFRARYLSYAFPGWRAQVNGQETPITASEPEGLITFRVPAGESEINVSWGLTPLRRAFGAVSLSSLAGVLVAFVLIVRRGGAVQKSTEMEQPPGLGATGVAVILGVALGFMILKLVVVDRVDTQLRRSSPPAVDNPIVLRGGELQLAGYDLSQESATAGDTFDIDLAWQVEAPPTADYQSNIWLAGPDGDIWSDKETQRPRLFEKTGPTRSWLPGQWAWDSREVEVLAGTPPGHYDIVLTLFDLADLQPLTLTDANGAVAGPAAILGQIEVRSPSRRVELSPQFDLKRQIGGLTLLGYSQDRQEAIPGERMLLTLFWQRSAEQDNPAAEVTLVLQNKDGQDAQSWTLPPVRADYPPIVWPTGQGLRGQHSLRLAGSLSSGDYTFVLEGVGLGRLSITAPERRFESPAYQVPVGLDFGGRAELVGYSLEGGAADHQTLALTLIWRGLAEMTDSYRVFVHVVDEEGQIVAQSDAEPAGWNRPTPGWMVGEYVVDQHVLQLPDGQSLASLSLRIGLYEAQNGERLPTAVGDAYVAPLADLIFDR